MTRRRDAAAVVFVDQHARGAAVAAQPVNLALRHTLGGTADRSGMVPLGGFQYKLL